MTIRFLQRNIVREIRTRYNQFNFEMSFSDEYVILLEKSLEANSKTLEENRRLREDLARREEEHGTALRHVLAEVRSLRGANRETEEIRARRRTTRQMVKVPSICRRTLRNIYRTLCKKDDFHGFYLDESVDSVNNDTIYQRVRDEVFHHVGGEDRCSWSAAQLQGAFRRYFLSVYETSKKKTDGKYEEHKKKCRKQGRIREKLARRTLALERCNWDATKKGAMAEVLHEKYMSSEDSEYEDESDNASLRYKKRKLTWESNKLSRRKRKLDRCYSEANSSRTRTRVVPREEGLPSERPCPPDCPRWAILRARELVQEAE